MENNKKNPLVEKHKFLRLDEGVETLPSLMCEHAYPGNDENKSEKKDHKKFLKTFLKNINN
ncbi:MAG: hypothetical protein HFI86_03275 [Bacilli bacterium]|nr:hypothetical protein [Bacilli bacterium]